GHAGRGDDSGEIHGDAGSMQAGGEKRSGMRAGFARIHTDEHVRGGAGLLEISAQSAAGGVQSGVVQRWCAGDAANTVGTEEFFGHVEGDRGTRSRRADRRKDDLKLSLAHGRREAGRDKAKDARRVNEKRGWEQKALREQRYLYKRVMASELRAIV